MRMGFVGLQHRPEETVDGQRRAASRTEMREDAIEFATREGAGLGQALEGAGAVVELELEIGAAVARLCIRHEGDEAVIVPVGIDESSRAGSAA